MTSHPNGYIKKDPSYCANCGDQVTNAGRSSRDGKRFCRKPECQAAKARRHRQRAAAIRPDREAPTTCAGCDARLPERPWRAGDDLGRWCRKVSCRQKRDRLRAEANLDKLPEAMRKIDRLETTIALLSEAVMADSDDYIQANRVVCHECGLTTALRGWVHPLLDIEAPPCHGTLDDLPVRRYGLVGVAGAWPFVRKYLTPTQLAALSAES